MTKTVTLLVKEITYETGITDVDIVSPKEWAGRMRRKKYKQTIITQKQLASLTINIKTKNNG